MPPPLFEIEGTAEDIQKRLADFAGERLHVTVQRLELPISEPLAPKRPIGLCEGQFTVPDSFFEPLPDELLRAFEGEA